MNRLTDSVKSSAISRSRNYIYDRIVSVITHKTIKSLLSVNVWKYILMEIGVHYKIVLFVIIIIL